MVKARKFRPYDEARDFVHILRLESQPGWYRYCKSGKKPVDIPTHPDRTYKDNDWIRWGDWLGYDNPR